MSQGPIAIVGKVKLGKLGPDSRGAQLNQLVVHAIGPISVYSSNKDICKGWWRVEVDRGEGKPNVIGTLKDTRPERPTPAQGSDGPVELLRLFL